ncbi:hypothetical protein ACH427_03105 [Streptomyces sp. NPDC020379]|uniref:hypothetical protein n=1 Tax=Streptomyces sp. NPDC020379 TaxID=3365071 RepID=UPI0037AC25C5
MLMPRPISPAYGSPPVVSMPHSSAIGSIHYVDCRICVKLIKARDACLERGDNPNAQKFADALTDHRAKRHTAGVTQ